MAVYQIVQAPGYELLLSRIGKWEPQYYKSHSLVSVFLVAVAQGAAQSEPPRFLSCKKRTGFGNRAVAHTSLLQRFSRFHAASQAGLELVPSWLKTIIPR